MGWNPFRRRKPETKTAVIGIDDVMSDLLRFGSVSGANSASSALSLYRKSSAVSVPVNMIAEAYAVIEPALQIGKDLVTEHPVLDLLKKPHPLYSQELFLEVLSKDYLVTGEFAFVAIGNVNREPLQLQPISPSRLTPIRAVNSDAPTSWNIGGNTLPGNYVGDLNKLRVRYLDGNLRELGHTRNYSTLDNSLTRGESPLIPASNEVRQHILGTSHNVSLLEHGGRLSLAFHFEGDLDPDTFQKAKTDLIDQVSGPEGDRILVTSGGKLSVNDMAITSKDMDWANLNAVAVKALALTYHVPLPLVVDSRQTLNNFGEAKLMLYDDAVLPLARRVFGGIGEIILPRFGLDPSQTKIVPDTESVTALVMRRNAELSKRKDIGIENDNELRALIGREEYEGGSTHYKPANLIPVGTDLFTADNDRDRIEEPRPLGGADDEDETSVEGT